MTIPPFHPLALFQKKPPEPKKLIYKTRFLPAECRKDKGNPAFS
jgi:hypothetical protein